MEGIRRRSTWREGAGLGCLCSPPLCLSKILRLGEDRLTLRGGNSIQDFVHSLLDSSVRFMKFAGRLRGELTELIAVGDVGESSEDKI